MKYKPNTLTEEMEIYRPFVQTIMVRELLCDLCDNKASNVYLNQDLINSVFCKEHMEVFYKIECNFCHEKLRQWESGFHHFCKHTKSKKPTLFYFVPQIRCLYCKTCQTTQSVEKALYIVIDDTKRMRYISCNLH